MFAERRAMKVMSDINREAMWHNSPRGGNACRRERSQLFFDKTDCGRNGVTATPLEGTR
jgi:hypothetical protein